MEAKEWRNIDKSAWGPGPWQDEPDKAQWADEATGLPCLIVRNRAGALCGYVGVPKAHPWFGVDYDSVTPHGKAPEIDEHGCRVNDDWVRVHGGLTFADRCQPRAGDEGRGVCHVVQPGEDDEIWWLGFDCAHSGDWSPAHQALTGSPIFACGHYEEYRTTDYVKTECALLAQQAVRAALADGGK